MRSWFKAFWLVALIFTLWAQSSFAYPVYHEDVQYTDPINLVYAGSRDVTLGGITGSGEYAVSFTISWSITDNGDGTYSYSYTLSNLTKALSHLVLEVGGDLTANNFWSSDPLFATGGPKIYSGSDPSNGGMPAGIFGLKFNVDPTISFMSDAAPIWGNFYAQDGRTENGTVLVYAYNNGLLNLDSLGEIDFIAVPGRSPIMPEPATLTLIALGISLASLTHIRMRRR